METCQFNLSPVTYDTSDTLNLMVLFYCYSCAENKRFILGGKTCVGLIFTPRLSAPGLQKLRIFLDNFSFFITNCYFLMVKRSQASKEIGSQSNYTQPTIWLIIGYLGGVVVAHG